MPSPNNRDGTSCVPCLLPTTVVGLRALHAFDRTNYARWIPVHMRDMAELPDVARKFRAGSFTAQKTKNMFPTVAIDQTHEQRNACIKGDDGAVGLTDNPSALLCWMVAGPEVARAIEEFQDGDDHWGRRVDTRHHDETPSVQTSFAQDVRSLASVIEELATPLRKRLWIWLSLTQRKWNVLLWLRVSEDWPRAVPGVHQRMAGGNNQAYL